MRGVARLRHNQRAVSDSYDPIAHLYDAYAASEDDVDFFRIEVDAVDGPVLELMAGTGRLSLPLIEAGASLVCVDRSENMLRELRAKLSERGLEAEVVRRDVRELELGRRFELAILPFQSFMELTEEADQRAALRSIHDHLPPGGRLVLSVHNPTRRRRTVDGVLRAVGSFETDEGTLLLSGIEQGGDPVVRRLQFLELFDASGSMVWKRLQVLEFSLIERERFESMAADAGFQVERLWGDYQRSPFDPEHSPVMIWRLVAS